MKRRRRRRRQAPYRNNDFKHKAITAVLVLCVSVSAGYLTAAYLLGPALGLETKPSFFEFIKENKEEKEPETEKEPTKTVVEDQLPESESGFAIQYGSFSSKEGAQECVEDLEKSGIKAEIIEKEGTYKVIGKLFDTREEARNNMEKGAGTTDVFITQVP